jgi:uncharacterized protein (TIRG00374 family)
MQPATARPTDTPRPKKRWTWKRIAGVVVSVVIVIGIFAWGIPRFANYGKIWEAMRTLTPLELATLTGFMVFNLVTYWWANQAALPGLGIGKAAIVTQTTTAVANTLPAGGAVAIGLTYAMLDSWGFSGTNVALFVGVTGIWNIFVKLGLPIAALAWLAVTGHATPAYVTAAVVGIIVLAIAVTLLALVFRSEHFARQIGDGLARVVSWCMRPFRRDPIAGWGNRAATFRADTIVLVHRRWFRLTWTTVLSQVALCFVLIAALRAMGVSASEVTNAEVFAVYAFARLLTAVPVTPGGVGVIDLGYVGGLAFFFPADQAQIVAAVLLFRALTYVVQIPIGGITYLIWRGKAAWRSPEGVAKQRAKQLQA